MKKASLKDIALKAGVSVTLVSYVLNNQQQNRINKETARKIRDVANKLNYRTNQIARSLKTNKTYTIGFIVADISNPFSASLARIIEDEAEKHNYTVLFASSDEKLAKSQKLIDTFINRQVDGLVLALPSGSEEQIMLLQRSGTPFVLLDRYFPAIKATYIALDNYNASFDAVNHIAETGKKRIGMITYKSDLFHLQERKKGYKAALKKNKIVFEREWLQEISIGNNPAEIAESINKLLLPGTRVDSILFSTNNIATQSLRYINSIRPKIPQQLALVSFDQTPMLDLFYAPVTYVNQPLQEMGQQALNLLLQQINGQKKIQQILMRAELVVRESTIGR